jgi:hypothetical protein
MFHDLAAPLPMILPSPGLSPAHAFLIAFDRLRRPGDLRPETVRFHRRQSSKLEW